MQGLSMRCKYCMYCKHHSVKEAFFLKEMAFWCYFEAKLNDSDVKFKIYSITGMEMQDLDTNQVCTLNLQGTVLMHFESILKHAERLGYEIQDILHGKAWFEQECESFEGLWVNQ